MYPIGNHSSFPLSLSPSANTNLLSSSMDLCFLDISYKLNLHVFFCIWLLSLTMFSRFIYAASFVWVNNIPLYGHIFACPLSADGHLGCLIFWLFWIKLLWTTQFFKWTNDLNIHFFKKDEEIANKHMKRYSSSLVIRQTPIKITIRYHFTLPIH